MNGKTEAKKPSPMEEEQESSVTVKLGKTHFDWLREFSKERFGLPNQAGMLRLILHEKYLAETQKPDESVLAEGNHQP
jgi:hypothetical protein